jgi:hypothetical protein
MQPVVQLVVQLARQLQSVAAEHLLYQVLCYSDACAPRVYYIHILSMYCILHYYHCILRPSSTTLQTLQLKSHKTKFQAVAEERRVTCALH